ncbi:hypothetical protein [Paraburkholderia aspalathi]|uniref:hypothetical protein n=1 Tax=Paraburkholderia aspalathi TaxID=1324617 RepID=UPI001F28C964|nr:hypothetical protein [Paraburkholderia aspalathi]
MIVTLCFSCPFNRMEGEESEEINGEPLALKAPREVLVLNPRKRKYQNSACEAKPHRARKRGAVMERDAEEGSGERACEHQIGDQREDISPAKISHVSEKYQARKRQAMFVVLLKERLPRRLHDAHVEADRAIP